MFPLIKGNQGQGSIPVTGKGGSGLKGTLQGRKKGFSPVGPHSKAGACPENRRKMEIGMKGASPL